MILDKYSDIVDEKLIELILDGNKDALNTLINRHKDWIFNVAIGMTGNKHAAEDVTQEVLIKIVTKLSTFKFKSSFRTWLYHIVKNHIYNMERKAKEYHFSSFEKHKSFLENLKDDDFEYDNLIEREMLIEETKIECMLGMLLCLDRDQRMIFIIGAIFGIDSATGASFIETSEVNYRKKLSRARNDLKGFMQDNCSLVNKNNKCKCVKKTKAAIQMGYVDPNDLQFTNKHYSKIKDIVSKNDVTIQDVIIKRIQGLFKDNPYSIFETKEFSELMSIM